MNNESIFVYAKTGVATRFEHIGSTRRNTMRFHGSHGSSVVSTYLDDSENEGKSISGKMKKTEFEGAIYVVVLSIIIGNYHSPAAP